MDTSYDIIVIGGGMAGCAAATSAARCGKKTLLIERFAYLGGWATAALVNPFMTHCTSDKKPLVGGLFDEIVHRLSKSNGIMANSFDPESMMFELQEMVLEAGVSLRLHTWFFGAKCEADGERITVETLSKSGFEQFTCLRLIDCSGDGDAATALGASFQSGDDEGLPQSATLMFDVGGVDLERAIEYVRDNPNEMRFPKLAADSDAAALSNDIFAAAGYYELVQRARDNSDYSAPGELIFYITRPRKGEVVFNTTHVGLVDGTSADDLTRAEIEGRRQMMSVVSFVRKYVPGFENAFLLRSAAHVGIRETRRMTGEYVFCAKDVIEARKYEDAICRLAYPVDVHSGKGEGYTKDEEFVTGPQLPPPGDWYEIPYRCLLPLGVKNVLIAGRCVSSTQAGHGAIRIMPSCVAMGQAAGTASAISIDEATTPANIDKASLIQELRRQGALV